ncbi:phage tail sheath subtilisin-like domain-containing protein [Blastococcus sp. BMG 814]|uniref:Phage tail sheath subtilisin-like domain-containing protein n=1 Tax=Blastococcus carthaginiensis TaxID=3050034 RepID=A0ABT9I7N0_9ACTN|nr:phage tail sheath subtilisin-like domain-containing protein [Blastococcus carthaginiensis]MDP5181571.1 phage tail sheath subtilisin-like domain-containing protein [Blastococcus carthaginiensis]
MAVTLTYPGVYVQEVPSGNRTITGVATAVTAFVGSALRGPVHRPVPISSYAQFERQFGGLWRNSGLGYAVQDYYLNGGNLAVIVRLPGGAEDEEAGAAPARMDAGGLTLEAATRGAWGDLLEVDVAHATAGPEAEAVAERQGVAVDALFHLTVREGPRAEPRQQESHLNLTVVDGPRQVDDVLRISDLVVTVPGGLPGTRPAPGTYTVRSAGSTGRDTGKLVFADYVPPSAGQPAEEKVGIDALRDADLFTILCLPPGDPGGDLPDEVWAHALALCAEERAFLLVDPPADESRTTIRTWLEGRGLTSRGRNGGIYFPRLRRADPLRDNAVRPFVPSGAVAGVMARTDSARGVWKAPAGTEAGITGATGLAVTLTDGENGDLNPFGINCLRTFRTVGTVVWGARTLRGADLVADEYKYVPVRRLALFLEETLWRNLHWVVFEPNDEPLWAQIRASIGAFLQDLFRQGAFQGSTPRDAYFVRCDAETTTQYDIDRGIVNIVVGFAPLKPAEFVVVSIQQKTATAS